MTCCSLNLTYKALFPAVAFIAIMLSGCDAVSQNVVDFKTPPEEIGAVAFLMKNEEPFLLVNMTPEKPRFENWGTEDQQHYIRKRAIEIVQDYALARKQYDGHDSFTMRMTFLSSKSEYDCPQWGSAKDVALLKLDRAKLEKLNRNKLGVLPAKDLRAIFISEDFK